MKMFNELKEALDTIQYLTLKKNKLQILLNARTFTNIQIHFFADKHYQTLYQADCPYSLETELKNLIEDIITQIDIEIENLKMEI